MRWPRTVHLTFPDFGWDTESDPMTLATGCLARVRALDPPGRLASTDLWPASPPVTELTVGALGGWYSAFGGAWKDAPIEGFQLFKFFRSPLQAAIRA